jgi:hypothetical protein
MIRHLTKKFIIEHLETIWIKVAEFGVYLGLNKGIRVEDCREHMFHRFRFHKIP